MHLNHGGPTRDEVRDHGRRAKPWRGFPIVAATLAMVAIVSPVQADDDFPLRETYADVPWISTEDLAAEFDTTPIIDVRSRFEYDVIHIQNAVSNPVAVSTFEKNLKEISKYDKGARMVFYCNGHTCAKSYKAVREAQSLGYTGAIAYDAGVFDWTRMHPEKAVLLGESPVDLAKLISSEKLEEHTLAGQRFIEQAATESAVLIDARDPMQRKKTPDFGKKQAREYYIAKLVKLLSQDRFRERANTDGLYVFDAAGKQVRWLQYYLEAEGYDKYYFLDGGVWAMFGSEGAN